VFGGNVVDKQQRYTFISYSRADKEFAIKLARELRSSGYPIWLDQFDIPAGSRWDDEVERALRECSIFMIILTPASIASMNVKDEIGFAIHYGKRILPILVEKCQVPLRLSRFQYVDFTMKSFEDGIESAKQLLTSSMNESTQKRASAGGPTTFQNKDAQAKAEAKNMPKTKRTAIQPPQPDPRPKEEAQPPARRISGLRQSVLIAGLIVLVIGLIAIFSSLLRLASAASNQTPTPVSTATSMDTPSPSPVSSGNTNISVSGQTGSIGFVVLPDGQSRDLVNGTFAVPKDSRVAIIQNGASLNLPDGTRLYLPFGTVFIVTNIQDGIELMLEQGSILARLAAGAAPLSIKTKDGLVAQVSGSIMGVQNSLAPPGIFVDCYEGNCTISGGTISALRLDGPDRYVFIADGAANPSDQTQRCEFWKNAIGKETLQGLGPCTDQQPVATAAFTPTIAETARVNAEATQRCIKYLREHHDRNTCP
jgi:ferric-dicitrate binding protein FerR (iron transport regulator)